MNAVPHWPLCSESREIRRDPAHRDDEHFEGILSSALGAVQFSVSCRFTPSKAAAAARSRGSSSPAGRRSSGCLTHHLEQRLEIGAGAERTELRVAFRPIGLLPSAIDGLPQDLHCLVGVMLGILVRFLVRGGPILTGDFAVEGEPAGQVIGEETVFGRDSLAEVDGLTE